MTAAPIVLVPGFWLGAWAWDEVVAALQGDGHAVTAVTLPGLESADTDRSSITFADHVNTITQAVRSSHAPVVLAVHSGAGFSGYAASDKVADRIAAMVYVDTGAGVGPSDEGFNGVEMPMPSLEDLAKNENLTGLSQAQLKTFKERAIPEPGGVVREGGELANDARLDLPSTVICTSYTSAEYRDAVKAGYGFVLGLRDLRDLTYVDLPTSHWPMWSRPEDLAGIISSIANAHPG